MEDFIYLILNGIVMSPDDVSVEACEPDASGMVLFKVSVAQNDMGRVIGKNGRTVRSIKTLFRTVAARRGINAMVDIQ